MRFFPGDAHLRRFSVGALLYEFPAETRLTVYRRLNIEWEYSSFSKSDTETVVKPGRLGPAQNGKPTRKFDELSRFCSMTDMMKSAQKTLSTRSFSGDVSPLSVGPSLAGLAIVSVLLFEKEEYVEPAVNRQPGFRRELVEQITLFSI